MALSEAAREALWLRNLAREFCFLAANGDPTCIFEDNQAALQIARDHRFSERTKHVALRHFFIREQIEAGELFSEYCSTTKMIADVFTKPLERVLFCRLRDLLGLELFFNPASVRLLREEER
jgi:hypothetical protein